VVQNLKKKSQKLCTQVQITEEGANRTVRFKVYTWVEIFKEQQHDLAPNIGHHDVKHQLR
jgi:hypothetical protein